MSCITFYLTNYRQFLVPVPGSQDLSSVVYGGLYTNTRVGLDQTIPSQVFTSNLHLKLSKSTTKTIKNSIQNLQNSTSENLQPKSFKNPPRIFKTPTKNLQNFTPNLSKLHHKPFKLYTTPFKTPP